MPNLHVKEGDRVLVVRRGGWGGAPSWREATVAKVRKTGHFLLEGSSQLYRDNGDPTGEGWHRERVETYDAAKVAEWQSINAMEAQTRDLNKVGEKLARVRGYEEGARLWALLPDEIKRMVRESE